ncbi:hypothetical protein [Salibaculum halophilum]|uniref:hypothetical protein n=1 Tax=Salibaculum halophilum TaxID=1914408 RepID=UPI00117ADD70|nr:hypothetical protein [Salibaculum halophilum]
MIICRSRGFIFLHNRKAAGSSISVSLARFLDSEDLQISAIPETLANGISLTTRVMREARAQAPVFVASAQMLGGRFAGRAIARSIDHAYRPLLGRKPPHAPAATVATAFPKEWSDCRKLCVVRNPWEKTVSDFFWRTKAIRRPPDFSNYVRALAAGESLNGIIPLEFHDNWPLYTIDGKIISDHVIRYDHLEGDLSAALGSLGLPWDGWLPRAKDGHRKKKEASYRSFYTNETKELIYNLYRSEIDAHRFIY